MPVVEQKVRPQPVQRKRRRTPFRGRLRFAPSTPEGRYPYRSVTLEVDQRKGEGQGHQVRLRIAPRKRGISCNTFASRRAQVPPSSTGAFHLTVQSSTDIRGTWFRGFILRSLAPCYWRAGCFSVLQQSIQRPASTARLLSLLVDMPFVPASARRDRRRSVRTSPRISPNSIMVGPLAGHTVTALEKLTYLSAVTRSCGPTLPICEYWTRRRAPVGSVSKWICTPTAKPEPSVAITFRPRKSLAVRRLN